MILFLRWLKDALMRGRDAVIGKNLAVERRLRKQGRLVTGRHCYVLPIIKAYEYDDSVLRIGSFSALSETATVMLGGEHPIRTVSHFPFRIYFRLPGAENDGHAGIPGDTVIGNDVLMYQNAFVRSGVKIGDGAVIAGSAVVTSDVPPYAVVGGNPARVIRYRFSPEQIEALLEIKWWDWPDEEIIKAEALLSSEDVDAFIAYARERFPNGSGVVATASTDAQ